MELESVMLIANFATALSYLWIPIAVFIYLQKRSLEIPEWASGWPRVGAGFALLCGFHHLSMTIGLAQKWQTLIDVVMAIVSVIAAMSIRSFLLQVDRNVRVELVDSARVEALRPTAKRGMDADSKNKP